MSKSAPIRSIAVHVEAAKRLLKELEQHAQTAIDALGQESGDAFYEAVDERERILAQLSQVVEALTQDRAAGAAVDENDPATRALFAEMAQAAAAAAQSQDNLASQARRERDRLATALHRSSTPDTVASQYAATSNSSRTRRLSVTG